MTADTRPKDTIRAAFEAMLALLQMLIARKFSGLYTPAVRLGVEVGEQLDITHPHSGKPLLALRGLIQRAAEEHNRRANTGGDWTPERIREALARRDAIGEGLAAAAEHLAGEDDPALADLCDAVNRASEAHAREDLPAALAEIERRATHAATWKALARRLMRRYRSERRGHDLTRSDRKKHRAEIDRLTAELAARASADASLEARAKYAATVYDSCGNDATDSSDEQAWLAVVRAVDASRPASPSAADLRAITVDWPRTNARRGALMDREDAGTLTAEETAELADLQRLADLLIDKMYRDARRPGLTEEQAREIAADVAASFNARWSIGLGQGPLKDMADRIEAGVLRASRGTTGLTEEARHDRHPDGTRDRVEPPDPRATLHDGNPESPFAPGSLAAGSATEDRILDRKRGGK